MKAQLIVIILGVIVFDIFTTKERIIKLYIFIVWAALIAMVWLFATGQLSNVNHLDVSFTNSINALALVYIIPFAGSVFLWNHYKDNNVHLKKIVYLIMAGLFFAFIGITGSRTALISSVVFILVYGLISGNKKSQGLFLKRFLIAVLLLIAAYIVVWKVPVIYNAVGIRIDELLDTLFNYGEREFSAGRRLDLIEMGWYAFLDKPVFGWGVDGFKRATGLSYYSHNTYIELLCDFGIIGFISYYSIYFVALKKVYRVFKDTSKNIYRFIFAALIMTLVSEVGTVDYYSWSNLFFLVLAFISTQDQFSSNLNSSYVCIGEH